MSKQKQIKNAQNRNDGLNVEQFDENVLVFDNIFSRGYGFSPQVLTRLPQLSIEAKGLYSYFSSFAGQGGVAFPSTQTILKETNISKNRFYKYRDELEAWGFITVEIQNTRHGRRTVYHLPVEPKPTDKVHDLIDAAAQARMHKVNNLPNAHVDNFSAPNCCGKPCLDGYPQTAGQEPRPQNEDLAYPCPQNQDDPRPQNEDMLNIVKSNKGKVSNDLSSGVVDNSGSAGSRTSDDPGCSTHEDARLRSLSGAEAPIDTLASSLRNFSLSLKESKAFDELCRRSIKEPNPKREAQAQQLFAKRLREGYLPAQVLAAYDCYSKEYKETNSTPRFAMQLDDWLRKESGFKFYAGRPRAKASSGDAAERDKQAKRQRLLESDPEFKSLCNRTTSLFSDWQVAQVGGLSTASGYHERWEAAKKAEEDYLAANGE
jgi:hypothetical protein